jgi:hypothetical protein
MVKPPTQIHNRPQSYPQLLPPPKKQQKEKKRKEKHFPFFFPLTSPVNDA